MFGKLFEGRRLKITREVGSYLKNKDEVEGQTEVIIGLGHRGTVLYKHVHWNTVGTAVLHD